MEILKENTQKKNKIRNTGTNISEQKPSTEPQDVFLEEILLEAAEILSKIMEIMLAVITSNLNETFSEDLHGKITETLLKTPKELQKKIREKHIETNTDKAVKGFRRGVIQGV